MRNVYNDPSYAEMRTEMHALLETVCEMYADKNN